SNCSSFVTRPHVATAFGVVEPSLVAAGRNPSGHGSLHSIAKRRRLNRALARRLKYRLKTGGTQCRRCS
ncbi:MAG: hypothetical protein JWR40_2715, partial [Massilia sp.]|nr:hypothetical protein [Massilia sp.]